jgi:glutamate-1-semialdehyde 2,1-aminomutase
MSTRELSDRLFARACGLIPGGVNSPVRAWRAVGGDPLFIRRGRGCQLWDADGNVYTDYVGSWGAQILGHAHRGVLSAIHEASKNGTSFGAPTAGEVELAQVLTMAFPGLDLVRLVSSGTEAAMSALRLARAATGRSKIIKFSGCYHGHADALLVRAGSGATTFGVPDSAGVPEAIAALTLTAEFNDLTRVENYLRADGTNIAAVIVEPVVGNMGVIPPRPGFLEGLRALCTAHEVLLIFDEVITGFRVAYGGMQTLANVEPDLTCLGKIVGGGMPLAAFGGRRALMEQLAPLGPVYQAGTLSGNPLAVAAGVATLAQLRTPGVYERLEALGARLEGGLVEALAASGVRGCVNRAGSMWTLFLGVSAVDAAASARGADTDMFARFFRGMLRRGVYLPPSQFEAAFISLAHSEAEVDATVEAARQSLAELGQ